MFSTKNNSNFYKYVDAHSGSIVQAYRTPEQFIAAVREDVANADGEFSRILIRNESDYIARLFKTEEELAKLTEANKDLADYLREIKSNLQQAASLSMNTGRTFFRKGPTGNVALPSSSSEREPDLIMHFVSEQIF